MTHTPTPWRLDNPESTLVIGSNERIIADCDHPQLPDTEIEANAAFIVRAVNCHDDLVSALKNVMAMVIGEAPSLARENCTWERAEAALAKVEQPT